MERFESELLKQYAPLKKRAMRLCGNVLDAEDLLQETMVKAWKARGSYEPGSNLGAWLFVIMRNLFYSGTRKSGRVVFGLDDDVAARVPSSSDMESAVIAKQAIAVMLAMPESVREVLEMAGDGLSYDEMAEATGLNIGTVKSRLSRARTMFRCATDAIA